MLSSCTADNTSCDRGHCQKRPGCSKIRNTYLNFAAILDFVVLISRSPQPSRKSLIALLEAASFTVRSTPDFQNTNCIEPKTVT